MRRRDPASVAGASNAATTLGWNGQTAKKRTVSNVTTTATSAPHRRPRGIPACVRRSTPRTKVQAARTKRGPAAAHTRDEEGAAVASAKTPAASAAPTRRAGRRSLETGSRETQTRSAAHPSSIATPTAGDAEDRNLARCEQEEAGIL